jgi:hypothetical protein
MANQVAKKTEVSRRNFLRAAAAGLALAAAFAPWKRLLPGKSKDQRGTINFPPGSIFTPRLKK